MNGLINRLKLSQLIIGALLFVGLVPILVLAWVLTSLSEQALETSAYNQLSAARAIKSKQVESYFDEREGDLNVLSNTALSFYQQSQQHLNAQSRVKADAIAKLFTQLNSELTLFAQSYDTTEALKAFNKSFQPGEPLQENARWRINRDIYGEHVSRFQQAFGWYDAYLINSDGHILYSAEQKDDLGQNVNDIRLQNSGLARAYSLASEGHASGNHLGDFAFYPPTNDYAAFVVGPVNNASGKRVGYVALQLPLTRINAILGSTTDELVKQRSFLVGSDKKLRSDAPFLSMLQSHQSNRRIETAATSENKPGIGLIRGYEGELVMAQWQPISISESVTWTLVNEVDINSALVPQTNTDESYFAKYLDEYGYYDLFLIHTDGEIFYTVTKEADYKTNILSGTYSDSNFGKLIQQVAQTQSFALADFSPYAPSQGIPAAFIAMPVFASDNTVAFYVALQLSLDSINNMMQLREGMGQTGETYLVGEDYRMRSDSFLDKTNHSVNASFAGSIEKNGVRTKASTSALSGQTGTDEIIDYNGNPVLSSYSPLSIGQTTWAVIAEIDVAETFEAIHSIKKVIWLNLGITVLATTLISVYLAKVIRKPLGGEPRDMMALAEQIADGDLTYNFEQNIRQGSVYASLYKMSTNLKGLISHMLESSQALASTAEETSVASEQTTTAVTNQQADTEMVATAVNQMTSTVNEVAHSTGNAASISKEAHQLSLDGIALLQKSMAANHALTDEINVTAQDMDSLVESAQQVDKVLSVIQTIAEQTNLLALNAAIEAARAGEHGRGFAIVADEVRQLASKTQDSTSDIQNILASVQEAANASVANMTRSVERANATTELSKQTAEAFESINDAIEKIDDMMAQISTASEEQAQVTEDINKRVSHISEVSMETSASAQQLSAASQEVARSAESLTEQTRQFRV